MKVIWLDNHLSPGLAPWLTSEFGIAAAAVRDLGLARSTDWRIFAAAKAAAAVLVTKDSDFVRLLEDHGSPPWVVLVTCGNTSTPRLQQVLRASFPQALELLRSGERLVEIGDAPNPGV